MQGLLSFLIKNTLYKRVVENFIGSNGLVFGNKVSIICQIRFPRCMNYHLKNVVIVGHPRREDIHIYFVTDMLLIFGYMQLLIFLSTLFLINEESSLHLNSGSV
ncbi:hypothetical protein SAY86_023300 [Trapa natans]|uniref:Uncharacterized protein n=1 Tax=Trapa natans TaxID=22666 RepID=A0AAN7MAH4_TRANT|nr:hypothetical protein SAY86_023300 [Trapa natans]